jgi:biotin transport system substrate-specific component
MAILIGSLVPAALLVPTPQIAVVDLPATWQVSALLVCAMVSGPRAGVIAAVAYLSMGFINLPVFHGGGGLNYILEPGFGYLAGFVPAAWLTGRLAHQVGNARPVEAVPSPPELASWFCSCVACSTSAWGPYLGRWSSPVLSPDHAVLNQSTTGSNSSSALHRACSL